MRGSITRPPSNLANLQLLRRDQKGEDLPILSKNVCEGHLLGIDSACDGNILSTLLIQEAPIRSSRSTKK